MLNGPYNNVDSNSDNSILKAYDEYCNNQLLNSDPNKPHIKGKDNEKSKNELENKQTFNTSTRTISEGIIENINKEIENNKGECNIQEFNNILIEHPEQQEPNLGINNIKNIESNNFHPQTIYVYNPHKPKKLIFNVISQIPKENKTIKINIREKNEEKKEIPSKMNKIFKTEIFDDFYDNYQYHIIKLKIDALIDKNLVTKGRISQYKKALGAKGKHNENSIDNLHEKIFTKCKESFDKGFLKKECKKYIYPNILKDLNIRNQKNFGDHNIFCNKTLFEIYIHSFPKNMKKSQKLEIMNDRNNINKEAKASIEQLINLEEKNKKAETKILYLLFNRTIFYVILNAFLFDRNIIIVDGTKIELRGFKTYKDYFKFLTPKRQKDVKEQFIEKLEKFGQYKFT